MRPARAVVAAGVAHVLLLAGCETAPREAGGAREAPATGPEAPAGKVYTFTMAGKPFSPEVLSLGGTPDDPREGDVVRVGRFALVLGPAGAYDFTVTGRGSAVELAVDGGERRKVAAFLGDDGHASVPGLPLAQRSDEEVRALRGVTLGSFPERLESDVARLDLERTCVVIQIMGSEDKGALARLPRDARYLGFSWCSWLKDMSFVRDFTGLRCLMLDATGVADLSPVGDLTGIAAVKADVSPVEKLPRGAVPSLRTLRALCTRLSDEDIAAFRAANPRCTVTHRLADLLAAAVAGATRLRVRTRGTCHRDLEREKTLFEMEGAAKVAEFVGRIGIDDAKSGFHCSCCGSPTIEIYRRDDLAAALGFHHGRSLRWAGGRWPGDSLLTPESADFLVDWLAERGVGGPKEELDGIRRQDAALKRRWNAYAEIMPSALRRRLGEADFDGSYASAFEEDVPDEVARAEMYLRLFGADEASWNVRSGLDEPLAERLLPGVGKETMAKAILNVCLDRRGSNGAARWLFDEEEWRGADAAALEEALPGLAARGLSHARQVSRRRTARALEKIGTPAAREALRAALEGRIEPEALGEDRVGEPRGLVRGMAPDAPDGCSDRAYAALVLARMGDNESLPTVRALAAKAPPADAETLERAIRLLEGKDEHEELEGPQEPEAEQD